MGFRLSEETMIDSGCGERDLEELLGRPLTGSNEDLSSLLTDCAAVALKIRAAILENQGDAAELERLSEWSVRISALMGEIRQRLDGIAPRA
jgi:hypothetical protein